VRSQNLERGRDAGQPIAIASSRRSLRTPDRCLDHVAEHRHISATTAGIEPRA
jgi:hypothetical protein